MAKNKGRFIIDDSISEDTREEIIDRVQKNIEKQKSEVSERDTVYKKRQDFYEGRHHNWTNVVGQSVKYQEGHILAVFNYILRFCQKVQQTLSNHPPKIKIKPEDEANEIETSRAERVEEIVYKILEEKNNDFFKIIFPRCTVNQIRDGDFSFECKVMEEDGGKRIEINPSEDLLKLMVGWDDAAGTSFSFVAFSDLWTVSKIKRDFGYDAEPLSESEVSTETKGDHVRDQYGIFATQGGTPTVPSGKSLTPKAKITDYWGYEIIDKKVRIVNLIFVNKENVQFLVTDYKSIPRFFGHSLVVAGKPWSMSFIDPLIDPQIELNDRSSEEGDLIRIGSHMKFLAINMTDFDPQSIKPGAGQVIFIEGEGADFKPLVMNISPFPSADYINRVLEHMYTIGIPKISLAAGTAPYTGKVGAIQYQPFADLIDALRIQWEIVLKQLIITIQQYLIDYFPETHAFMNESLYDDQTGEYTDGEPIIREIEFDWENILPLSRSDRVIDAANMRDRNAISLHTFLEQVGFRDAAKEIKKLKKEAKDEELMVLLSKFQQYAPGTVRAQLKAQQEAIQAEENNAELLGNVQSQATPAAPPVTLNQNQNEGRQGVLSSTGTPTGQTATPTGAVNQATQNINAKSGV